MIKEINIPLPNLAQIIILFSNTKQLISKQNYKTNRLQFVIIPYIFEQRLRYKLSKS